MHLWNLGRQVSLEINDPNDAEAAALRVRYAQLIADVRTEINEGIEFLKMKGPGSRRSYGYFKLEKLPKMEQAYIESETKRLKILRARFDQPPS